MRGLQDGQLIVGGPRGGDADEIWRMVLLSGSVRIRGNKTHPRAIAPLRGGQMRRSTAALR